MFRKSILLAFALYVTAVASGTAPASAAVSHSLPYPSYLAAGPIVRPPPPPQGRIKGQTSVQPSHYPIPHVYRQRFQ